jgi:hypothetical protein
MNDTTYTRAQVTTALGTAHGMIDAVTDTAILEHLAVATWAQLSGLGDGPFTREQVTGALNTAADLIHERTLARQGYENEDTIRADDVLNLAVNVTGYLLDHPQGSLDEAIAASWAGLDDLSYTVLDALPEGAPEPAKGTPERDAAIVATVLEWVS